MAFYIGYNHLVLIVFLKILQEVDYFENQTI